MEIENTFSEFLVEFFPTVSWECECSYCHVGDGMQCKINSLIKSGVSRNVKTVVVIFARLKYSLSCPFVVVVLDGVLKKSQ